MHSRKTDALTVEDSLGQYGGRFAFVDHCYILAYWAKRQSFPRDAEHDLVDEGGVHLRGHAWIMGEYVESAMGRLLWVHTRPRLSDILSEAGNRQRVAC